MRPFVLYTILPLLFFTCLSLAFEVPQFFQKLFPKSPRIPQFILDTQHPWLQENNWYLGDLNNSTQALCSLDSKLRPGNGAHERQYPQDLFNFLEINNNRAGISRPGWKNARLRVREMLDCPAALHDVQSFNVEVWINDGQWKSANKEPPKPPGELPGLFLQLLASMPNLWKLQWNTFGNGDEDFQRAFTDTNVTLPSVRHLIPAMSTEFLVNMCPNVEHLQSGHQHWRSTSKEDELPQLIKSTKLLANLTNFAMGVAWETKYLEGLLDASPNLTTLKMGGEIQPHWRSDEPEGTRLEEYADILAGFPRLENLHLPTSSGLGLGFDGGHWCGNAYDGQRGRAYGRSVSRQNAETTEKAGQIVLERLPDLKTLNIGEFCANLSRSDRGVTKATWPWSGRMKEWTYERWGPPEKWTAEWEDDMHRSNSTFEEDEDF